MKWSDSMALKPVTTEEVNDVGTVQGMRKRLNQYAYRGDNPLVKTIFEAAHYRGLSGEDTMTWLAYEALIRIEHLQSLMLDDARLRPYPSMIVTKAKP